MDTARRYRARSALTGPAWLLVAVLSALLPLSSAAQQPTRSGLADAALELRQLDGVKRVLMIGAHPDDEDSALLAALARGYGVETAYLSLTRGDGGQNLIGPELSAGLGIVRTGELQAARSIDGARQYFTRALDYGFSKSVEEAFSHWPREEVLRDVVWVIRSFRPQVIVSVFSGTAADGHGQHQVAGILAPEAFGAAADRKRFPEQLQYVQPWQATKIFRIARREPAGTPTTVVPTGVFDPILGRSWYQVAMEGRSQHRSQDMGAAQPPGPRASTLVLIKAIAGQPGESLFAGVDTTLAGLVEAARPDSLAQAQALVGAYRAAIHEAEASLAVVDPGRAAPPLQRAIRQLDRLAPLVPTSGELADALAHHRRLATGALLDAAGIVVDAAVGDPLLVPGEQTTVTVRVWNGGAYTVDSARAVVSVPTGWTLEPEPGASGARGGGGGGGFGGALAQGRSPADVAASGRIAPGELAAWTFRTKVPEGTPPSDPYFMREPRQGDLYRWPNDPSVWGLPGDPPLVRGGAALKLTTRADDRPLQLLDIGEAPYLGVDQALGEFREPLLVMPALSVATDQGTMAWPLADRAAREVAVQLRSETAGEVQGTVRLEAPAGWTVEPAAAPFDVKGRGALTTTTFRVRPPAGGRAERVELRAVAEALGRRFDHTIQVVDYPHIRRTAYLEPATDEVSRVAVQVKPGLKVGYIMGTGDGGYDALRQMKVDAELLGPKQVEAGDFGRFNALVVGVRAYEVRPDLVAANARLLDFARAGGTVIVQYQQYQYANGGFAPYPVTINNPHDRVTDENAPVKVLEPGNPLFNAPNHIGAEDWQGWKQERGLYFLGTWDDRYTPLLEMNDPGEAPLRGSLLVAPLGKGVYVYTAVAFFRQFPAAVPGAYRLFANLVSLDAASWGKRPTPTAAR